MKLLKCDRGTSAVEFALIAPLFLTMLFGVIVFGSYLAMVHGVQQMAAEAVRASIPGLSDSERASLAATNISANAPSYPMIAPARLSLVAAATNPATNVFAVTLSYDASNMFVFSLPTFVPAPPSTIVRSAAIARGGY